MRPAHVRPLFAALFVVGLLGACGDDGGDDATAGAGGDDGTAATAGTDGDGDGDVEGGTSTDGGGGAGTVTVDGTQYGIDETRTCDPAEVDLDMVERELELQGMGSADGDRVQIDVYIEELVGNPSHQVSWSGPEGIYGGSAADLGSGWNDLDNDQPLDGPPIEVSGGRVTGEATMASATGEGDPVTISFDLAVPGEFSPCR